MSCKGHRVVRRAQSVQATDFSLQSRDVLSSETGIAAVYDPRTRSGDV